MPALKHVLAPDTPLPLEGCSVCGAGFAAGETVAVCDVDGAIHHPDCWQWQGDRCGTPGCAGQGALVDSAGPPPAAPAAVPAPAPGRTAARRMVACPRCGRRNPPHWRFCPACSYPAPAPAGPAPAALAAPAPATTSPALAASRPAAVTPPATPATPPDRIATVPPDPAPFMPAATTTPPPAPTAPRVPSFTPLPRRPAPAVSRPRPSPMPIFVSALVLVALMIFVIAIVPKFPGSKYTLCLGNPQHCVMGAFLAVWQQYGGTTIVQTGLIGAPIGDAHPVTDTQTGVTNTLSVQLFENFQMEEPPGNQDPAKVGFTQLGTQLLQQRGPLTGVPKPQQDPNCRFIDATQHNLCGPFRAYWETIGRRLVPPVLTDQIAVGLLGYPISEEMPWSENGQVRTVQWFERARLDVASGQVVPAPLGREAAAPIDTPALTPTASPVAEAPTPLPTATPTPTPTEVPAPLYQEYTVEMGESIATVAQRLLGHADWWCEIKRKDGYPLRGTTLYQGDVLLIPVSPGPPAMPCT